MENPFVIKPYENKELFCDREAELQLMVTNCLNYSDMTLISQRRIGKTGLIMRLMDELKENHSDIATIYFDIMASRTLDDFIKLFAEAIMKSFKPKTSIGNKFMTLIKSMRPQLTFDNITGEPQFQLVYQSPHEKVHTLQGLIEFLDNQGIHIVIAIDEFQQIREYPEQNMEALLRTYIQHSHNLTFIYCGSKKHMMTDMFVNEKKPFYSSTSFVTLKKISVESYSAFIKRLFADQGRAIDEEAVNFILDWTRRHTYYTQMLCHTVYAHGAKNIGIDEVKVACQQLLTQGESTYLQYRQLLTPKQWSFLIAVAKEGSVRNITSAEFLGKYKIGSPSSASRLVEALLEKGLINDEVTLSGTSYELNEVFFSRWLEKI